MGRGDLGWIWAWFFLCSIEMGFRCGNGFTWERMGRFKSYFYVSFTQSGRVGINVLD